MRKAEENEHNEDQVGHLLPSTGVLADNLASAFVVRPGAERLSAFRSDGLQPSIPIAFDSFALNSQPIAIEIRSSNLEPFKVSRTLDLDQLQTLITNWAVDIRRTKADAMEVVLKPNADTEVSLRLSLQQHGLVEVAAEFKRGDLASLNVPWAQLQDSLSTQGIRLGALQPPQPLDYSNDAATGGFGQSLADSGNEAEPPAPSDPASSFTPVLSTPAKTSLSDVPAPNRRWESWA